MVIISIIRQCLNSCPPVTALLVNTHFPAGAAPCLWSEHSPTGLVWSSKVSIMRKRPQVGTAMQRLSVAGETQLACTEDSQVHPEGPAWSSVSHVLHRGDGAVAGDPGRCLPHAPLAQTEGSISVSLKQLYFPNVPSPSTDAISFPESFQLDSKWPFIALCKF